MRQVLTIAATVLLAAACGNARAQTVEAFYKGNRVSIDIGYTPGGIYDIYARAISASTFPAGRPSFRSTCRARAA
jgi:hypothetical protein